MKIIALLLLLVLTAARLWFAAVGDVLPSEAYHWMGANQLDWAFFDGPGGTAALVSFGQDYFGATPFGIRFLFPIFAFAASIAIYLLGRNLFGVPIGLVSAAFLNALPFFNVASVHASPAIPALAFALLAAWAAWQAIERKRNLVSWIITGACIALGIQFRYTLVLFWPAILIICLSAPRYRPQLRHPGFYFATILTIAGCLPGLLWNSEHHWAPLALGTFQTIVTVHPTLWPTTFAGLHAVLSVFAALYLLAAFVFAARSTRHHLRPRLVATLAAPFYLLWFLFALHGDRNPTDLLIAAGLTIPFAAWLAQGESPIFRTLRPVVLILSALASAAALAAPSWHPTATAAPDDTLPWRSIASAAEALRSDAQATQPAAIFFIAKNPAFTAALNYHLPRIADGEPREVFLRESQDLSTQFGLWPRYDDFVESDAPPDEYFTELRATNPYFGRSALYITDAVELPQTIAGAFRLVSPAATLDVVDASGQTRTLRFYFCEDYQTMPL